MEQKTEQWWDYSRNEAYKGLIFCLWTKDSLQQSWKTAKYQAA